MAHLPGEILLDIFERLEDPEDLISCTFVNKSWNGFATAVLLSKLPLSVTGAKTLKALTYLSQQHLQENANCVEKLDFDDSSLEMGPRRVKKAKALLKDLKFPRLKSIKACFLWPFLDHHSEDAEGQYPMEKLAFSLIGLGISELILTGSMLFDHKFDKKFTNALILPANNITSLKFLEQHSYDTAAIISPSINHLKTFFWSSDAEEWALMEPNNRLHHLLSALSQFAKLDKVELEGFVGPFRFPRGLGLINATEVTLSNHWDPGNVSAVSLSLLLVPFNPKFLRKLCLSINDPDSRPRFLLPLTQIRPEGKSVLTEFEIKSPKGAPLEYWPTLRTQTLINIARNNSGLRVLTLGSPYCFVDLPDINDDAIKDLGSLLPSLERLTILGTHVYGNPLTLRTLIHLGTHCRDLQMLSLDEEFDISAPGFSLDLETSGSLPSAEFCLFPNLKHYDTPETPDFDDHTAFPKGKGDECATPEEKEEFLSLLRKHFPSLSILSRSFEVHDGRPIPYCRWDEEESGDGVLAAEYFMTPYYWRD